MLMKTIYFMSNRGQSSATEEHSRSDSKNAN